MISVSVRAEARRLLSGRSPVVYVFDKWNGEVITEVVFGSATRGGGAVGEEITQGDPAPPRADPEAVHSGRTPCSGHPLRQWYSRCMGGSNVTMLPPSDDLHSPVSSSDSAMN